MLLCFWSNYMSFNNYKLASFITLESSSSDVLKQRREEITHEVWCPLIEFIGSFLSVSRITLDCHIALTSTSFCLVKWACVCIHPFFWILSLTQRSVVSPIFSIQMEVPKHILHDKQRSLYKAEFWCSVVYSA